MSHSDVFNPDMLDPDYPMASGSATGGAQKAAAKRIPNPPWPEATYGDVYPSDAFASVHMDYRGRDHPQFQITDKKRRVNVPRACILVVSHSGTQTPLVLGTLGKAGEKAAPIRTDLDLSSQTPALLIKIRTSGWVKIDDLNPRGLTIRIDEYAYWRESLEFNPQVLADDENCPASLKDDVKERKIACVAFDRSRTQRLRLKSFHIPGDHPRHDELMAVKMLLAPNENLTFSLYREFPVEGANRTTTMAMYEYWMQAMQLARLHGNFWFYAMQTHVSKDGSRGLLEHYIIDSKETPLPVPRWLVTSWDFLENGTAIPRTWNSFEGFEGTTQFPRLRDWNILQEISIKRNLKGNADTLLRILSQAAGVHTAKFERVAGKIGFTNIYVSMSANVLDKQPVPIGTTMSLSIKLPVGDGDMITIKFVGTVIENFGREDCDFAVVARRLNHNDRLLQDDVYSVQIEADVDYTSDIRALAAIHSLMTPAKRTDGIDIQAMIKGLATHVDYKADLMGFLDEGEKKACWDQVMQVFPALDMSQREGINRAIEGRNGLFLLQGPPGTGKTTTIVCFVALTALGHKRAPSDDVEMGEVKLDASDDDKDGSSGDGQKSIVDTGADALAGLDITGENETASKASPPTEEPRAADGGDEMVVDETQVLKSPKPSPDTATPKDVPSAEGPNVSLTTGEPAAAGEKMTLDDTEGSTSPKPSAADKGKGKEEDPSPKPSAADKGKGKALDDGEGKFSQVKAGKRRGGKKEKDWNAKLAKVQDSMDRAEAVLTLSPRQRKLLYTCASNAAVQAALDAAKEPFTKLGIDFCWFRPTQSERETVDELALDELDENARKDLGLHAEVAGLLKSEKDTADKYSKLTFGYHKYQTAKRLMQLADGSVMAKIGAAWFERANQIDATKARKKGKPKEIGADVIQDFKKVDKALGDYVLERMDVVFVTCNSSCHEKLRGFNAWVIIVDEAAQTTELDTLIPFAAFKQKVRHGVFAADQMQLGPVVLTRGVNECSSALQRSLFARLAHLEAYRPYMLTFQYRMHPHISAFSSRRWYGGKLLDADVVKQETALDRTLLAFSKAHATYGWGDSIHLIAIDVGYDAKHQKYGNTTSLENVRESQLAQKLIHELITFEGGEVRITEDDIQFLTPYTGQKRATQVRLLAGAGEGVSGSHTAASTITQFQGRQKPILITSFTAHDPKSQAGITFIAQPQRLNVCLTRAQRCHIMLGNWNEWFANEAKLRSTGYDALAELAKHVVKERYVHYMPADWAPLAWKYEGKTNPAYAGPFMVRADAGPSKQAGPSAKRRQPNLQPPSAKRQQVKTVGKPQNPSSLGDLMPAAPTGPRAMRQQREPSNLPPPQQQHFGPGGNGSFPAPNPQAGPAYPPPGFQQGYQPEQYGYQQGYPSSWEQAYQYQQGPSYQQGYQQASPGFQPGYQLGQQQPQSGYLRPSGQGWSMPQFGPQPPTPIGYSIGPGFPVWHGGPSQPIMFGDVPPQTDVPSDMLPGGFSGSSNVGFGGFAHQDPGAHAAGAPGGAGGTPAGAPGAAGASGAAGGHSRGGQQGGRSRGDNRGGRGARGGSGTRGGDSGARGTKNPRGRGA